MKFIKFMSNTFNNTENITKLVTVSYLKWHDCEPLNHHKKSQLSRITIPIKQ